MRAVLLLFVLLVCVIPHEGYRCVPRSQYLSIFGNIDQSNGNQGTGYHGANGNTDGKSNWCMSRCFAVSTTVSLRISTRTKTALYGSNDSASNSSSSKFADESDESEAEKVAEIFQQVPPKVNKKDKPDRKDKDSKDKDKQDKQGNASSRDLSSLHSSPAETQGATQEATERGTDKKITGETAMKNEKRKVTKSERDRDIQREKAREIERDKEREMSLQSEKEGGKERVKEIEKEREKERERGLQRVSEKENADVTREVKNESYRIRFLQCKFCDVQLFMNIK